MRTLLVSSAWLASAAFFGVTTMVLRFSFFLVGAVVGFCQAGMPTNRLARWLTSDSGLAWGLPAAVVLAPSYWLLAHAFRERLEAGGSGWWWVAFAWALINCVKFFSVGVRAPFLWVTRLARRRLASSRDRQLVPGGSGPAPSRSRRRPPSAYPDWSRR